MEERIFRTPEGFNDLMHNMAVSIMRMALSKIVDLGYPKEICFFGMYSE